MINSLSLRVSCMVAQQEDISVSTVVCLGYPLKGINEAVRDEKLLQLSVPVFFVPIPNLVQLLLSRWQRWLPLDKLDAIHKKIRSLNELLVIEGCDYSFKIGRKFLQSTGTSQAKAVRGPMSLLIGLLWFSGPPFLAQFVDQYMHLSLLTRVVLTVTAAAAAAAAVTRIVFGLLLLHLLVLLLHISSIWHAASCATMARVWLNMVGIGMGLAVEAALLLVSDLAVGFIGRPVYLDRGHGCCDFLGIARYGKSESLQLFMQQIKRMAQNFSASASHGHPMELDEKLGLREKL
ncbi:hypothetical protein RJ641_035662 [Dillenia turbinata]|uniref:Uncharacterized protein n=1 Tax=Dillenia turbinata TaxID=194707 RepID=A0AAN8ZF54_9MAGN